jgi:hypothetical protein
MVYLYWFEGFVCRILLPHVAREFPNLPADGASGLDMDATYQGRRGAFQLPNPNLCFRGMKRTFLVRNLAAANDP